jgi:hypothetical protein
VFVTIFYALLLAGETGNACGPSKISADLSKDKNFHCFGFKTRTCAGLWFRCMTQGFWLSLLSFVAFGGVEKSSSQ